MNLKGLIHRELGEGMTEKELASAIVVPLRTLVNILAGVLFEMGADDAHTADPPRPPLGKGGS